MEALDGLVECVGGVLVRFLRWYFRVFASFLFLIFLVSALPVAAISALSHLSEKHVSLQYPGEYVYVTFYQRPVKNPIVNVETSNFSVGYSGVQSYPGRHYTYFETPEFLLGDAEKALAKAGYRGNIYVPVTIGSLGVLLQVNGSTSGPDCIILGNQSVKKGTYLYELIADSTPKVARVKIESVQRVVNVSRGMLPLAAFMKADGIKCIASGKFFESILTTANLSPDLSHLLVEGFLLASPDKINLTALYQALYSEFSPHNYYPKLYILKPGFVKSVLRPSSKHHLLKTLWASFMLLLPSLPLIGVVLTKEGRDERKLRNLLRAGGANPLIIDLITAVIVGVAAGLAVVWMNLSYSIVIISILIIMFSFRYFLSGLSPNLRIIRALHLLGIGISGLVTVGSIMSMNLTLDVARVLAYPFHFSASLYYPMFGVVSHYLPWIAGASFFSLLILLLFDTFGKPNHRMMSRIVGSSMILMLIFVVYSGVIFSSPVTGLYPSSSAGFGATIVVQFKSSPNATQAYNEVSKVILEHGGTYGTLWYAGIAYVPKGEFGEGLGMVLCYDKNFTDFLKSTFWRSRYSRVLYNELSHAHGKILISSSVLRYMKHSDDVVDFGIIPSLGGKPVQIKTGYTVMKHKQLIDADFFMPYGVARVHNLSLVPYTMFVYGNVNLLKALQRVQRKYRSRTLVVTSLMSVTNYMLRNFLQPSVAVPFVLSAFLIISVAFVLGLRDRRKLDEVRKLLKLYGFSKRDFLPLIAFLPLTIMTIPMIKDTINVYSLGFIPHHWGSLLEGYLLLMTPLLSLALAPLVYVLTMLRTTGGV
ncbi:MAG: hypothetical protein GXO14_02145 [Thermococci archaeon]|nr:hypothetical protein [Thermococci archaeon]